MTIRTLLSTPSPTFIVTKDRTLEQVLSIEDPRLINRLLSYWYSDKDRTMALRRILLHSLSHLEPEHAELVSASHRKELYFELQRKRNDPYLVCAILKGLAGIEDHAPVADVILLADGKRSATEFPQIQTAAREYLLALGYPL